MHWGGYLPHNRDLVPTDAWFHKWLGHSSWVCPRQLPCFQKEHSRKLHVRRFHQWRLYFVWIRLPIQFWITWNFGGLIVRQKETWVSKGDITSCKNWIGTIAIFWGTERYWASTPLLLTGRGLQERDRSIWNEHGDLCIPKFQATLRQDRFNPKTRSELLLLQ